MRFLALWLLAVLPAMSAHAACSSPSGNAGDKIYNATYYVPQYCNGRPWVAVGRSGLTMPTSGLIGWWKLDDGSGTSPVARPQAGSPAVPLQTAQPGPMPDRSIARLPSLRLPLRMWVSLVRCYSFPVPGRCRPGLNWPRFPAAEPCTPQ